MRGIDAVLVATPNFGSLMYMSEGLAPEFATSKVGISNRKSRVIGCIEHFDAKFQIFSTP